MAHNDFRVSFTALLFGCLAALIPGHAPARAEAPSVARHPDLMDLPPGRWVKIHQQRSGDAVTFKRQRHGGSAFDTRRGRLVLFGSDTHDIAEGAWLNAPLVFDMNRLAWTRAYPADPISTYRVSAGGLPVAGPDGSHPWAMHTFGAVTYDPARDAVVVSSWPAHLEPGRFTSALAAMWSSVARHPTWLWHPATGRWEALPGDPVHFFAAATAYDNRRNVVLGYRGDGIYALQTSAGQWRRELKGGLLGWGNNAVFDTANGVLIGFGSHAQENDIVVYDPATGLHRKMPTPGPRPPGRVYVPMAFHAGAGRTVVLINQPPGPDSLVGGTESWHYDYARDTWTHVAGADLPFAIGMNYNLAYDPGHDLLVLVATPPDKTLPAVWALKLTGDR